MSVKRGYKQTDVGVIPEEWEVRRFRDLFDITAGGDVDAERTRRERDEKYRFPVYSNALNDSGLYGYCSYAAHSPDSLTVTARGTLGYANYRDHAFTAIGRVLVLKPLQAVSCGFIEDLINDRISFAIESTGVPQLTAPQISAYKLPVPPLPEQRAIAAALSDVDALIASLDRLIAKKRDLKQAAMQQLLTGQTRLPGFGGKWEQKAYCDVFVRVNSKLHQVATSEYLPFGVLPVVDQGQEFVVAYCNNETKRFRCPSGGVVVFGDHTCIVKYVDFDFIVGADGTQVLATKFGQNARFRALDLELLPVESTGYNRHFKFLKERKYPSPSFEEQSAIASVLSDMDAELAALERRRDKTKLLKQGMMQELLTGKTRLV